MSSKPPGGAPGGADGGELRAVRIDLREGRGDPVCLLHGFGASSQDLVPLAGEVGQRRTWLFPGAPVPIRVAGMHYGHAWFPREEEELEKALYGGYFLALQSLEPEGLADAARQVRSFLDAQGVDWSGVVVGGFSQGAMVVAEVLRQALVEGLPQPRGAMLLSGALVARRWWDALVSRGDDEPPLPPVLQVHGTADNILPVGEGRALHDVLVRAGFPVQWYQFSGDHSIPRDVAVEMRRFLRAVDGDGNTEQ